MNRDEQIEEMAKFDVPKIKFVTPPPTYDDMIAELVGMSYQSPVQIISQGFRTALEDDVMKAIHSYGIYVDKDELIKALQYDRDQYERGFADGCAGYHKQSEWISVDEALPKQWETVLVCCEGEVSVDFISSSGRWYEHYVHEMVTHWMPLPQPPKMRKEDEGK